MTAARAHQILSEHVTGNTQRRIAVAPVFLFGEAGLGMICVIEQSECLGQSEVPRPAIEPHYLPNLMVEAAGRASPDLGHGVPVMRAVHHEFHAVQHPPFVPAGRKPGVAHICDEPGGRIIHRYG